MQLNEPQSAVIGAGWKGTGMCFCNGPLQLSWDDRSSFEARITTSNANEAAWVVRV